jgi:hypothetical protein
MRKVAARSMIDRSYDDKRGTNDHEAPIVGNRANVPKGGRRVRDFPHEQKKILA